MIEVDARLRLATVALDAKGDFHKIARLAKVFLHDLDIAGAFLLVHLRGKAAGEFQNPVTAPAFVIARLPALLVRDLAVAVFNLPSEGRGLGDVREGLIADVPNLLPPRRVRPMRFRALGDSQGEEVVDAGLAGVRAGLDDQRFAFGIGSAGSYSEPMTIRPTGDVMLTFCAM